MSPNPPSPPDWPKNREPRDWDNSAQHQLIEPVSGGAPKDPSEGPYEAKEKAFDGEQKALLPDQLYFMGKPLADKSMQVCGGRRREGGSVLLLCLSVGWLVVIGGGGGVQWNKELPKALADAGKDWKLPPSPKPVKPWFFRQLFPSGAAADTDTAAAPPPEYGHFDPSTEHTLQQTMGAAPPKSAAALAAAQQRLAHQNRMSRALSEEAEAEAQVSALEASARSQTQAESEAELYKGIEVNLPLPPDSFVAKVLRDSKKQLTRMDYLIERMQQTGTLAPPSPLPPSSLCSLYADSVLWCAQANWRMKTRRLWRGGSI